MGKQSITGLSELDTEMSTSSVPLTLGSQLKAARLARGLSGYKVAALAGIKSTHLYDIENGHRLYPRQATVNRIAAVLGVRVAVSVVAVEENSHE